MGGVGNGPVGTDDNRPVIDHGTLIRGASPCVGTLCIDTHPNNRTEVDVYHRTLQDLIQRADVAKKAMELYLQSNLASKMPEAFRNETRGDLHSLATAQIKCLTEFERVSRGSVRNFGALDLSLDTFSARLVTLELANERWEHAAEVRRLEFGTEIVVGLAKFTQRIKAASEELPEELERLEKKLRKAKREYTEAKWQMWIDAALYATSLAVPVVGITGVFVKSTLFTAAVMTADHTLGPSSEPLADLDVAAGSLIEACPHGACPALTHAAKQYAGLASAMVTTYFDVREVNEAHEVKELLEQDVGKVLKGIGLLDSGLRDLVPKLPRLRDALKKLIQEKAKIDAETERLDQTYRDHKKEFGK